MTTKTIPTQLVIVKRDFNEIATEVPEHEIQILKALHLEENVQVAEEDYGEMEIEDDSSAELLRLRNKYDQKNAPSIVNFFFRDAGEVASKVGLKKTSTASAQAMSVQSDAKREEIKARKSDKHIPGTTEKKAAG